jgi:hypothetical protein
MNAMIKDVLATGDFGGLQTFALVIFVALMSLVCLWIILPGSKSYYERIASDITKGPNHE